MIESTLEPDSVVGIATRSGLEGSGIEFRWGEIFRTYPDRLWGPPRLVYNWYRVFPGGKGGRGMMLNTHPLLVPRLRESWAIPPLALWVLLDLLRGSLLENAMPITELTYFISGTHNRDKILNLVWITSIWKQNVKFLVNITVNNFAENSRIN